MNSLSKSKLGQAGVTSDIIYLYPHFQEVISGTYLPQFTQLCQIGICLSIVCAFLYAFVWPPGYHIW